jgi:hypothetical protein
MDGAPGIAARFTWHPLYAGRTLFDVRDELVADISADQRALAVVMDAAEEKEDDALAKVLEIEKRWSPYDLNWAETDPRQLADRILEWRWQQEKRHDLFPFSEMRESSPPPEARTAQPSPTQASWLDWLKRLFGR